MFKKGDKVIPIGKSVGKSWDFWLNKTSKIVQFYLNNGYLIYNGMTTIIGGEVCLLIDGETYGGDFFLKEDLKPYVPSKALSLFFR